MKSIEQLENELADAETALESARHTTWEAVWVARDARAAAREALEKAKREAKP